METIRKELNCIDSNEYINILSYLENQPGMEVLECKT